MSHTPAPALLLAFVASLALPSALAQAPGTGAPKPAPAKADEAVEMPTLYVGDDAPALAIAKWIAGTPVEKLEKGKVYLVSPWGSSTFLVDDVLVALSKLQKEKGAAGLTVIATACDGLKPGSASIEKYAKEHAAEITFALGYEKDSLVDKTWREAAKQVFPPNFFLVDKQGKIAWIGDVDQIEPTLTQVLAEKHDLAQAAAAYKGAIALELRTRKLVVALSAAEVMENWEKVVDNAKKLLEMEPVSMGEHVKALLHALGVKLEKPDEAYAFAKAYLDGAGKDSPDGAMGITMAILDADEPIVPQDFELALRAARRAVAITKEKDAECLIVLATVHARMGKYDEAVAVAKQCVAIDAEYGPNLENLELRARTHVQTDALEAAMRSDDWNGVAAAIDQLLALEPVRMGGYAHLRMIATGVRLRKPDEAYAFAKAFVDGAGKDSANALNAIGWSIVDPGDEHVEPRDLVLAERVAKRAIELTKEKDADCMDTLAFVYFHQAKWDDAIAWAKKCAALNEEYAERVEQFERERKAKGGK
ncbi:MAG: tetratricopeptide repeat protein [Planctomycetes bacterium]|nr:tetratricopeptide repeat protein [Planctomycetota bacterium]